MISGTQTLFNWSLRSDSRSIYPHIVRAGFAGLMLLAVLGAWGRALSGMAPGLDFFEWICKFNVILIAVSGISYFVSAVTEEKDAGTLSLLRLAGVSPLAIVLSKSTSRLISALMLLLIQLPFTFLAITLGGVTWQQIIAAYLALAAWLCLVANMALFCSVKCTTSGRAATLATAVLLLFFVSGPILLEFSKLTNVSWLSPRVLAACEILHEEQQRISVTTRLNEIFNTNAAVQFVAPQFWRSLTAGAALFLASVVLFNRYTEPVDDNTHGTSAAVRRYTVGRCWKLAVVWKDFLFFTGGKSFLVGKLIGYALLLMAFSWFHQLEHPTSPDWFSQDMTRTAFGTVVVLLSIEMVLYSSNSLFLEVRQSAVATLKMLPIPTPLLLLQKTLACTIALSPAILAIIFLFCYDMQTVLRIDDLAGATVGWIIFISLLTHLTVLLSMYMRWAALPLAVAITTISYPCIGAAAIGLTEITAQGASLNGLPWGIWLAVVVNLVWMWLFVLLPIEIEIVNRWNRLSRQ